MFERLPIRSRAAVCLIALTVATTACGGDDDPAATSAGDSSPSQPAVGAPFAAKAVAVCEAALAQKQAQGEFPLPEFNPTDPDPSKLPVIAPFLAETAVTFESWQSEMEALGEPPSGRDPWEDLVGAVSEHARIASEQAEAAASGDVETFVADYHQGTDTQPVLLSAANAAGVPECAAVDR
jgi:hypothetical protein